MQKTILYAVLNWGLGHVTRSLPIIKKLVAEKHQVILVSDGLALTLLKKEFPQLSCEETIPYAAIYASSKKQFNWKIAQQIPKFISTIKAEQAHCKKICAEYGVDVILSDNRYGFYHEELPSAFICHQLRLLYPDNWIFENLVNKSYANYLDKFDQIWVPDFPKPHSISGKLSSWNSKKVNFIGASSRLEKREVKNKYRYLALLSGPEPQRSILENLLVEKLANEEGQHLLIRGTNLKLEGRVTENIRVVNLASSEELNQLIGESEVVICRSGYTSVVDLLQLKQKAILVPTPGQVEQEYLAKRLEEKRWFHVTDQDHFSLEQRQELEHPEQEFGYNYAIIQDFVSCSIS